MLLGDIRDDLYIIVEKWILCTWYVVWWQDVHIDLSLLTHWGLDNGRHFADAIYKCIFLNEDAWIQIKISLKFVLKGPINNIPASVQIMVWHRPGAKPLS